MKSFTSPKSMVIVLAIIVIANSCKKGQSVITPVPVVTDTSKTPKINNIDPAMALPNSVVSIMGKNFNTTLAGNLATINGVNMPVDSVTATQIWVTVPLNATSGIIKLVTGTTTLTSAASFTVTSSTSSFYANGYLEHIAFGADGNAYGDDGTSNIYKITPAGVKTVLAATGNANSFVWGTVVDAANNVYSASTGDHKIYKITPAGVITTFAGTGVSAYVDGSAATAQFGGPVGLAIDAAGNLYTNDSHRVRKITPDGTVSTVAGNGTTGNVDGPAASAEFGSLEGICVDKDGNIFVGDNKYLNIRKISNAGIVSTLAGSGVVGSADGQGSAAQFQYPQGMAVDAAGNLFVSDNNISGNLWYYAVRMINRTGLVTTFLKGAGFSPVIYGNQSTTTVNFPDGIAFDKAGSMYICNTVYSTGTVSQTITKVTFK